MDDLISRKALKEAMYHEAFEVDSELQKWDGGCWIRYKMFENVIDDVPSVDAVEVVRCKDCIHYKGMAECECVPESGGTMWFCAWGERKTDG